MRSEPIGRRNDDDSSSTRKRTTDIDIALTGGKIGVWLAVIAFGGIFWAVNGGFSVLGLGIIANSFNDAGKIAWAALTALTFPVPVSVPNVPTTQPLIPWLGVVASSLLQVAVVYLKLRGRSIPMWLWVAATVMSLYDFATTYFGIGTIAWVERSGHSIQAVITLILTFAFETTVGLMARQVRK